MPTESEVADAAWGVAEPAPRVWASGRWSLELRGDELADLRCDGVLLARSIRFAARDRDWSTVPLAAATAALSDDLVVEARYLGLGARWTVTLTVTAGDDRLDVRLDATTVDDWERARVGLVLLHPPSVAGLPLRVDHPDGSATATAFPARIAPHQPALDIAALSWPADGLAVRAEFDGEVFEMEDHRNWTDASFKTYGTPLALPVPVALAAGSRVAQTISFVVDGHGVPAPAPHPGPIALVPTGRPFPEIGLAASTAPGSGPASPAPFHLLEIDADAPGWRAALDRGLADAEAAGADADVRLFCVEPEALAEPVAALAGRRVVRLGATATRTQVTEPGHWAALVAAADGLDVELVAGARSHFTEVNRRLDDLPASGGLAFALTPGAHNEERAQLVESVAMQRLVASTAAGFAAGRPVHVGPVTLRPRYLTFASRPLPAPEPGIGYLLSPDADDPRQPSTALAAWTVASAAALAVDGIASIAYFETWGPRGVRAASGEPYPVADAIEALAALGGAERLAADGILPPDVWIAAGRRDGVDTVLLANLAARDTRVAFRDGRTVAVPALSFVRVDAAVG